MKNYTPVLLLYESYCITECVHLWLFSAMLRMAHMCQTTENGEMFGLMPIQMTGMES